MKAVADRAGAVTRIADRLSVGVLVLWAFGSALCMATHPLWC